MPTLPAPSSHNDEDIEVLVTGFGPFGRVEVNPSWLCTQQLHKATLDPDQPPQLDEHGSVLPSPSHTTGKRKIHIQTIETSVAYSQILDLVPRIHGFDKPASEEAEVYLDPHGAQPDAETHVGPQGNGDHFPRGYRSLRIPAKGYFDHVIHVGQGQSGFVALETLAHKRGYQLADVRQKKAPQCDDQSPTHRREAKGTATNGTAEERERQNMGVKETNGHAHQNDDPVRGFGQGYMHFAEEERTPNHIEHLLKWLTEERHHTHIRQSIDPGRFLCDFIFYCSLCEAQRAGHGTHVQFIHVPALGHPYTLHELQRIIAEAVWWLVTNASD